MFRIVHICTYSHMHSPFVGKKKEWTTVSYCVLFLLESQVIFKWSMIHILYICSIKIKCILKRNGDDNFFREFVQGTGGGGGAF